MSTKALIDRIVPFAEGYSRTGTRSIIKLIEEGQDILFEAECPLTTFVGTDNTGFPPYLETTDGTETYEIANANLSENLVRTIGGTSRAVNCRRGYRVFVDVTNNDYTRKWLGLPGVNFYPNPYAINNTREYVANVPCEFTERLENDNATVRFPFNPGTNTTMYFIEMIWEPLRLTAETIPLCVPLRYEPALFYYVMGQIQLFANGKPNDYMAMFEAERVKFQNDMTRGIQKDNWETTPELA
jgi:hypothetical protein